MRKGNLPVARKGGVKRLKASLIARMIVYYWCSRNLSFVSSIVSLIVSLWEGKGFAAPRLVGAYAPPFRRSDCNIKGKAVRKSGFTLLEVLLSIALVAVVITVLYSTFFLSRRAIDAVDDSLVRLQECRSALDLMRREMESAYLRDGDEKHTLFKIEDRDFFGSQTSQVTFTSFTPQAAGLAKITYRIDEGEGQLMLTKKIVSPFSRTEEPQAVPLIEDVESFTVEVRFNDRWVRTWDTAVTKKTPQEIRISLGVPLKRRGGLSGDARQAAGYRLAETVQPRRGRVP